MKPNHKLLNDIQEELHRTFYSANIAELNRSEFNLPTPQIILDDSDFDPAIDEEKLYDALGYFSQKTSDSIYLCPKKIEASASKRALDLELFTTIIYIHEAAHYFHFHAREKFMEGGVGKMTAIMAESFAQLLTHRVCQQLNDKALLDIFVRLSEEQPIEYRQYKMPYVLETSLPFEKQKKVQVNNTIIKDFSIESIVKAFVTGPLKKDYGSLIHSVQKEADNKFLAENEPYLKTADEYGLFDLFKEEDEKFIN